MVLQSLVRYYEILADDPDSDIAKPGYSKVGVSYALNISKEGELLEVIPLKVKKQNGKKIVEVSQPMLVPEQQKKASGIASNFLCEKATYIFGAINSDADEKTVKRIRNCFEACKNKHEEILCDVDCDEARAVINFFKNWDADTAMQHQALQENIDDIIGNSNLIFKLDGGKFVHDNQQIKSKWEEYKNSSCEEKTMQCLVTGEKAPVAKLHTSIKGVKGAQSSGGSIVSFNDRAYESYGKTKMQGYNSPVSEYATFAYTTVLNSMLADRDYKLTLGDSTVVYWAESPNCIYKTMAKLLFDPPADLQDDKIVRDERAEKLVGDIFSKISKGQPIGSLEGIDENTHFNVLALSPNAARLSVRFFIQDSFGSFVEKITRHYEDMRIEKEFESQPDAIPLWKLLSETVPQKSKDKSASPLLAGSVMSSILTGLPYPDILYSSIINRFKVEATVEINNKKYPKEGYYRASAIKACLIRKHKNSEKYKEVLTMALNEQSENSAYLLGRLFAILEKAQKDAGNETIREKFFSSACATPSSVFPTLLRLSQHHISKSDYGYSIDKKIEEILNKLDIETNPIPSHLSLDDQGVFILGYYHQRNANYKKINQSKGE